jgi:hypothetical protein
VKRPPVFGRDAQGTPGEVCLFVPPEAVFPGTEATPTALIEVLAMLSRDDTRQPHNNGFGGDHFHNHDNGVLSGAGVASHRFLKTYRRQGRRRHAQWPTFPMQSRLIDRAETHRFAESRR